MSERESEEFFIFHGHIHQIPRHTYLEDYKRNKKEPIEEEGKQSRNN